MKESDILSQVMVALSRAGALVHRNNTGALPDITGRWVKFGLKGSADILACLGGRFLAIETKAPKGRLREEQKRYGEAVSHAGGIYAVVRSLNDLRPVLCMFYPSETVDMILDFGVSRHNVELALRQSSPIATFHSQGRVNNGTS